MKHSDNRVALLKLVKLDLPIDTVRWEVFGTPESTGLVPGSTNFLTLIAEISPAILVAQTNTAETAWITPGAARLWLTPSSRALRTQHSNSQAVPYSAGNCAPLQAELTKSGEKVQVFLCSGKGQLNQSSI